MLHYEVSEVPYVVLAEELGVGCADLATSRYLYLWGKCRKIQIQKRRKVVEVADAVEEVDSCSACYGYLIPALGNAETMTAFLKNWIHKICIGQGYRGKTGKLGVGALYLAGLSYNAERMPAYRKSDL